MQLKRAAVFFLAGLWATGIFSARLSGAAEAGRQVESLRAFARLYGYVRFFHPSDEVAATDWKAFAVYGAGETLKARSQEELLATLNRLFKPLAPTITLYREGETPAPLVLPSALPKPGDKDVLAWQHKGVSLERKLDIYRSVRLNRENKVSQPGYIAGVASRALEAASYRGKEARLTASLRVKPEVPGCRAHLWLRVDRPQNMPGFFDNMLLNPVLQPQWQSRRIEAVVADDAASIHFGYFILGAGHAEADDFVLEFRAPGGSWQPAPLENLNADASVPDQLPPSWGFKGQNMNFKTLPHENGPEGNRVFSIEAPATLLPSPLFPEYPKPGECWDRPLGNGLRMRMPLALYNTPVFINPSAAALHQELAHISGDAPKLRETRVRLAGIIITWNVFQHFYPYFDIVKTDWSAVLTDALQRTLNDSGDDDFLKTLRLMTAQAHDGHAMVWGPDDNNLLFLPARFHRLDNRLLTVAASAPEIQKGDEILEMDGAPVMTLLTDLEAQISGSPQWKRIMAVERIGQSVLADTTLKIRRGDAVLSHTLKRIPWERYSKILEFSHPDITEMEKGIWLVDLNTAPIENIMAKINELAEAKGVIFDLRRYPNGNHAILSHLMDKPDASDAWMRTAYRIYPDNEKIVGMERVGWGMQPALPRIKGKVVFLISPRAISYAESVLSLVEGYKLGELLGEATAGTNGNTVSIELPGGVYCGFTGMRVVKHDGGQLHLTGVQPTIRCERTEADIKAGRDTLLEKALELLRR